MPQSDELKAILADAGVDGPIEGFVRELAELKEPRRGVIACTVRAEEAAPHILAPVRKAAAGTQLSIEESRLAFRGSVILAGARHKPLFSPLLDLLARPEYEDVFGDVITEHGSQLIVGAFDGDVDRLFAAILDVSQDEWVRDAMLGAAAYLTWAGDIDHARTDALLREIDDQRRYPVDDHGWIAWQQAIALLGLETLAPRVEAAFADGRIPFYVMSPEHFRADLSEARRRPESKERFERQRLGLIEDTLALLERWFEYEEDGAEFGGDPPNYGGFGESLPRPISKPLRHLGRNDPCPCGSGRKYKKCCLHEG